MIETVRTNEGKVSVRVLMEWMGCIELAMSCKGLANVSMVHKLNREQAQVLYHALERALIVKDTL